MKPKITEEEQKEIYAQIKRASKLIYDVLEVNNISIGIGLDAMQACCANTFLDNGRSYEDYSKMLNITKKGYKALWEKDD